MTDNNKNINAEELELFGGEDFVFTKDQKGNIVGGGYKITSLFLQGGQSIMKTLNTGEQNGGKVSSPFENLAVPAGITYIEAKQMGGQLKNMHDEDESEPISDTIHDELLKLVSVHSKNSARKTRRNTVNDNKTNKTNTTTKATTTTNTATHTKTKKQKLQHKKTTLKNNI